jgi:MarR family transcriptional regulator for hemolysin
MQDDDRQLRDGFGGLVSWVVRQWRRAADRPLHPFGLSEATWLPLIYLARAAQAMRQKDLAVALTLDGSSVARLLDALEASCLIERGEEHTDRRAKLITITAQGWSIIEQVEIVARDVRNATLSGLSDDDLRAATRVLNIVCRNLAHQLGWEE